MIAELKSIRDESIRVLDELLNGSDENEIQNEIELAVAEIRKKYSEKRESEIAEKKLEIKALNNIIEREEKKQIYDSKF